MRTMRRLLAPGVAGAVGLASGALGRVSMNIGPAVRSTCPPVRWPGPGAAPSRRAVASEVAWRYVCRLAAVAQNGGQFVLSADLLLSSESNY